MRAFRSPIFLLFALSACGGFDAGNPYRVRPSEASDPTIPEPGTDEDDSKIDDDGGPDSGTSTPPPPQTDSGPPPPKTTVFTGAPAYVATTGPTTRKTQHNFAGATPTTNPAGRPCMQCHGAAGPAPRFLVAGTTYTDATGTPAPQVEIRIVGADGVARTTFSNGDGNYFFPASAGAVMFPATIGARDANTTKQMTTNAANGNCNSCHRAGGTTPPLVVE